MGEFDEKNQSRNRQVSGFLSFVESSNNPFKGTKSKSQKNVLMKPSVRMKIIGY